MKHLIFTFFLLAIASSSIAQNSTDELLSSPVVRNYLHFFIVDEKIYYQVDKNTDKKSHKLMGETLSVAVPLNSQQIALSFNFINPFKEKIIISETTEPDGAYESLSKFYNIVTGLTGQLAENSKGQLTNDDAETAGLTDGASGIVIETAKKMVHRLSAPSLIEWRYNFLTGSDICIKNAELFNRLQKTDESFYRSEDDENIGEFFPVVAAKLISDLSKIKTVKTLTEFHESIESNYIVKLSDENKSSEQNLRDLKSWDYSSTFDDCPLLKDYTKKTVDRFVDDATILQNKRMEVVTYIEILKNNIGDFLKQCDEGDNTMIAGRVELDVENVKIASIKTRKAELSFHNNEVRLIEDASKDKSIGKVRIRNYHLLIPEFAVGGFYTSLTYPSYGTSVVDGKTVVNPPTKENYSFVSAGSLNLILNLHGLVNPMLQFGVGTGKQLPSFLTGGGIRLTKPKHLSISFGALWTWRKELDKLKINDVIETTSALENDLKYQLTTKPSFYIGLNYGF